MSRRVVVLLVLASLAALALPSAASADPRPGGATPWWDWRPDVAADDWGLDEDAGEDAGGLRPVPAPPAGGDAGGARPLPAPLPQPDPGGAWYDDLEIIEEGARPPRTPAKPARPTRRPRPPAPSSRGLRGVRYRALILRYARQRRLEPALVAAVIHAESAFNPRARSRVGARGLMQLMPATARSMGARVSALYRPATNIAYGTLYLARVRQLVGPDVRLMAAAYNAGPGAVRRFRGIPPYAETRTYVRRVVALRAAYRRR